MADRGTVVVIGAGAAGTFAALAARGAIADDGSLRDAAADAPRVVLLDGQDRPGRKILISGGGRCNATNAVVRPEDFETGEPKVLRSALREFGVDHTRRLLASVGIELVEEAMGKLFPASGRAADVLAALRIAHDRAGVESRFGTVARDVRQIGGGRWAVDGLECDRVVLATGGLSIPATGSDGFGLRLAEALGLQVEPAVPALAALEGGGHADLAGLAIPAVLQVGGDGSGGGGDGARGRGRDGRVAAGSLLFTHRGVSGPAALDVAAAVERARARGERVRVTAELWAMADPDGPMGAHLDDPKLPGAGLPDPPRPLGVAEVDRALQAGDGAVAVQPWLSRRLPRRLVEALLSSPPLAGRGLADVPMARLPKADRQLLAGALAAMPIAVERSAGFAKAEVTAGGVRLSELHRRTLEARAHPGLHLCGEVCDVTGRLGGFNFQWAWTSGVLAGRGAAAGIRDARAG